MSALEEAVKSLAGALDALETRLDDRLGDFAADAIDAARRQARTARAHAADASEGLAAAIDDLKSLLNEDGRPRGE